MTYRGILGDPDFETAGFGRFEILLRLAKVRFTPHPSPPG